MTRVGPLKEAQTNLANGIPLLWVPARIDLSPDKTRLVWTYNTETRHAKTVLPGTDLLGEFTDLGRPDTSPEEIRNFAKRYGILRICKHGLPASHSNSPYGSVYFGEDREFVTERIPYCQPLGTSFPNENEGFEPLDRWRFFARHAHALLNVIVSLSQDELAQTDDWAVLHKYTSNPERTGRDLVQQRLDSVAVVNTWLRVASVAPQIRYDFDQISLRDRHKSLRDWYKIQLETDMFRGSRLFAYLACQLMTAAVGQAVSLCSGCGKIYPPTRKPNRNQNNYCKDCSIRAAWRDAARRKRTNDKLKREAAQKTKERSNKTKKR